MTLTADHPDRGGTSGVLAAGELPALPGRVMSAEELLAWVRELADHPELWERRVAHDTQGRHYVSLHRDADVDVWLLCWNLVDDTGWHDHDVSSGAVAVTRGAVHESRPRLGGDPAERVVTSGRGFGFGPDHIHRMGGSVDGSVSIHAYSPPLWRMGQYAIAADGEMRRVSVSYAEPRSSGRSSTDLSARPPRSARVSTDELWLRFVSGPDVAALGLTPADVVAAATDVVAAHGRGETVFEPRTHLVPDNGGRGHFNVLRGHVSTLGERGVSGVKVVGDFVPNYELGLPSELALLTLYDPWTGVPRAIVDATWVTEVRTGAMTAVGARHLARPDAKVLGHVGARGTAHANVVMLDAMFDLDEIRVTSRRAESREAFADRLRAELDTPVVVTDDVASTLDGADIAVEATRLVEPTPLVTRELVAPGALLVPYGTVSALAPDLLDVVDKVVVDDWREAQAGEFGALRPHLRSGALTHETLHAEIGEVVTGARPGREDDAERILFWHRGLSILDVAVGHLILERAERADLGTLVRFR